MYTHKNKTHNYLTDISNAHFWAYSQLERYNATGSTHHSTCSQKHMNKRLKTSQSLLCPTPKATNTEKSHLTALLYKSETRMTARVLKQEPNTHKKVQKNAVY